MQYPISVILISYNTALYIEECLKSIFSQDLENFELIIIDNASSDGTTDIIKNYITGKQNVTFIENKENLGGSIAGNTGIKMAKGEYVYLMDSDDIMPQGALKALYESAVKTNSDVVIGRAKSLIEGEIRNIKFNFYNIPYCYTGTYKNIKKCKELLISPFYWGRIYRTKLLLEHNVFMPENFMFSDMYLNSKALRYAKNITVIEHLSYIWRRFKTQDSHVSITSPKNQKRLFNDRLDCYYKCEEIFSGSSYKKLLRTTRFYNLVRLFLLAKYTTKSEHFAQKYYKKMRKYLHFFSRKQIINYLQLVNCKYLNIKNKTLCFLIKAKRFDEYLQISNKDFNFETELKGKYLVVKKDNRPKGVPFWFLRELPSAPNCCTVSNLQETNDSYIFSFCIKSQSKASYKLARIIVVDSIGNEIYLTNPKKHGANKYNFAIPKEISQNLESSKNYYINVEFLYNYNFCNFNLQNNSKDILIVKSKEKGFSIMNL
ncbi:MAG: glycosyltransferase family 2 protein [Ruminococcaceae bacterium]|nr:glycosyltransferase family 2 protein [Oscillospiraceae bacterium]